MTPTPKHSPPQKWIVFFDGDPKTATILQSEAEVDALRAKAPDDVSVTAAPIEPLIRNHGAHADLVAALKEVCGWFERNGSTLNDLDAVAHVHMRARAALAKAEGEK